MVMLPDAKLFIDGELRDATGGPLDDGSVGIGTPVRVGFERIDDELALPVWQVADEASA